MRFVIYYIILLCFTFANIANSQSTLSSNSEISLLTCDPGSELYSTFGHTAIRVKDVQNKIDVAFNYGIFDFDTPGFYTKFLRGKLDYMLGAYPYDSFMREYRRDKRSVTEQVLELDSLQKNQIFQFLVNNAKKENRYYKYDFFFDNCTTRSRDLFTSTLGIVFSKETSDKTFRDLLDEFLPGLVWSDFGIDLVIGAIADRNCSPYHQTFLPDYMMKAVDNIEGVVSEKAYIIDHSAEREKRFKPSIFTPLLLFGILLLLEFASLFIFKTSESKWVNWYDKAWFWIAALSSLLLFFMWFGTDHMATKQNWNLLWINPLYLVLVLSRNERLNRIVLISLMVCTLCALFFWTLIPQNYHQAFLPMMIILMIKLIREWNRLKSKSVIQTV